MDQGTTKYYARGAILLTIGVLSQQLRLLIPLPPVIMTLVIGTLVNTVLMLGARYTSRTICLMMAFVMPLIAFLQGHLATAFMIPVVFCGNALYALLGCRQPQPLTLLLTAPIAKAAAMAAGYVLAMHLVHMPGYFIQRTLPLFAGIQAATGMTGVMLASFIARRQQELER
jgi:hypothetical protein